MEEVLLLENPEAYVYEIAQKSAVIQNPGTKLHRAADWGTAHPVWRGRLSVTKKAGVESCCIIELKDRNANVYGTAILTEYPGKDLRPVLDSSRYFTLNVQNRNGYYELVGLGFRDRKDTLDLLNAIRNCLNKNENENYKRELDLKTEKEPLGKRIKNEVVPEDGMLGGPPPESRERLMEIRKLSQDIPEQNPFNSERILAHFFQSKACMFCHQEYFSKNDLFKHLQENHPAEQNTGSNVSASVYRSENETTNNLTPLENENHLEQDDYTLELQGSYLNFFKILNCAFCPGKLPSRNDLIWHFRDFHLISRSNSEGTSELEETIPGKSISWQSPLAFPFKLELGRNNRKLHSYSCIVCDKKLDKRLHLVEHLLIVHLCDPSGQTIHVPNAPEFSCRICGGWFDSRALKWKHLLHKNVVGTEPIVFTCPDCEIVFPSRPALKVHLIQFHKYGPNAAHSSSGSSAEMLVQKPDQLSTRFSCQDSGVENPTAPEAEYEVSEEIIGHTSKPVDTLYCAVCSINFKVLKNLRKHYRKVHQDIPLPEYLIPSPQFVPKKRMWPYN